jgi:hypothetical protein
MLIRTSKTEGHRWSTYAVLGGALCVACSIVFARARGSLDGEAIQASMIYVLATSNVVLRGRK